jgi:adenylate cyclase
VRIPAQLIDGATNGHIWAERYDRDLNDIFALQDEISEAIVKALKLKLLPEEKKAIEQRGTGNPEAYDLYLMARQYSVTGNIGSARQNEAIIRLCKGATGIDPGYARAWAMMANAQGALRFYDGREGDNGLEAAERALALDDTLAEAHSVKAEVLIRSGRLDEARVEVEAALSLDPDSYEVNRAAARWHFAKRQFKEAIIHYEKASSLMDTDYHASGMLLSSYAAIGDNDGLRRAAQTIVARTQKIVAQEPDNGSAMGYAVDALMVLGETERSKGLAKRALLLDPDNLNMRYNFACAFVARSKDYETGLELLGPLFENIGAELLNHAKADPDFDAIRDDPRFMAMLAGAERRLAKR